MTDEHAFWHVVADQSVGVLDGGFLPGSVRLARVDGQGLDVGQACELAALIGDQTHQRQVLFAHTHSHPVLHGSGCAVFQPPDQGVAGMSADGHHEPCAVALPSDDGIDLHAQRERTLGEISGALLNGGAVGHPTVGGTLCTGGKLTTGVVAAQAHARVALAVVPAQGLNQPVQGGPTRHPRSGPKGLGFPTQPSQRLGRGVLIDEARFDRLKHRVGVREVTRVADTVASLLGAISLGREERVGRMGLSGLPRPGPAPTLPRDAAGAAIELFGNCRTTQSKFAECANNRQFLGLEVCVCLHQ